MEIRIATSNSNCVTNSSMPSTDHSSPNSRSTIGQSLSRSSPNQGSTSHHQLSPSMGNPLFSVNRILSRNSNGTIAMTSQPTNESELQLYRVLQRSNLLSYYDTFICQGGDDVQQLCDAGEEEFLEIMALVGMASKPLHVRRLQKALQEWVSNPAMFQAPLVPTFGPGGVPVTGSSPSSLGLVGPGVSGHPSIPPSPLSSSSSLGPVHGIGGNNGNVSVIPTMGGSLAVIPSSASSHLNLQPSSSTVSLTIHPSLSNNSIGNGGLPGTRDGQGLNCRSHSSPSSPNGKDNNCNANGININGNISNVVHPSTPLTLISTHNQAGSGGSGGNTPATCLMANEYGQPSSPISLTPVLVDSQITRLAEAAESLIKSLPPMDPKLITSKKKKRQELESVIVMAEDDPRRMGEIRKYSAIFGRYDCKRNPNKPLTLHEVSVNEAAAQICKHMPALLRRRDTLFDLARQVVRESGYQYSKGHSRSQFYPRSLDGSTVGGNFADLFDGNSQRSGKRRRLSENDPNYEAKIQCTEEERMRKQNRLENIVDQLKTLGCQQKELKVRLQQARDIQNISHINQVQSELEHISTQQMQLINEQSEINKQLKKLEKLQSGLNRSLNRSLSEEKGDTDDTDSQFSAYSNELSPCMSQPGHDDSPIHDSSQNSDNFSRILPAKSGNLQVSNQLTRQLVHETLLDEGLRLVKEFTDIKNKETEHHHRTNETNNNGSNGNNNNNNGNGVNSNSNSNSSNSSNNNGIDLRIKQIETLSPKPSSDQAWAN